MSKNAPLVLMILDGWGFNENAKYNAIAKAHTPQWDAWWQTCPHILLNASGLPVGLPAGQMGNSEVGHMHIGSGRRIQQDFTRINEAIEAGQSTEFETILHAIKIGGALKYTMEQARREAALAIGALEALPPSIYKDALIYFASFSVERSS